MDGDRPLTPRERGRVESALFSALFSRSGRVGRLYALDVIWILGSEVYARGALGQRRLPFGVQRGMETR